MIPPGSAALAWSVIDGFPGAAIIVFDRELRLLALGGEALARRGDGDAAQPGRPLAEILPEAAFARIEPFCRQALSGTSGRMKADITVGRRMYATEFSPLRSADGAVVGGLAVGRDVTEAREAQLALAASEQRFRELAEQSTDLQAHLDADGVFIFVSAASNGVLGYAPQELLGTKVADLMHPDDLPSDLTRRRESRRDAGVVRLEARLRHRDDSWRWCEATVARIRDPDGGAIVETHASIRDITQRRENEQRSEQWDHTFIGTSRGISITAPDTMIIQSVNPAYAAMHGGRAEDFVGQPITFVLPPKARAGLPDTLGQLEGDELVSVETEHLRLDGTSFPVRAEVLSPRDSTGLLYRITWIEDLSDQRAAEAAQRAASEMFETAFSRAPTGISLIGTDNRFLRVNAALCEMLGRTEDEIVGSTSRPFTHPDDLNVTADALSQLSVGAQGLSVEKRYVRPNGDIIWASTHGSTMTGPDGQPTHYVSHYTDITAMKLAELRQANAAAQFETALFSDAPIGMALLGLDGHWLKVNRVLCALTGFTEQQMLELTFQEITHPDDLTADQERLRSLLAGEVARDVMELRLITATGQATWINLAASLVRDPEGAPSHLIAQIGDISERQQLQASLQRLADHDPLTDLWNRRRFSEELQLQIARCQRYDEQAALLVLDLDGFKLVNDAHGHQAGDDLLRRISEALQARVRETDSLARLGGDEFAALIVNVTPAQADDVAAMLADVVSAVAVEVDGGTVSVTVSVGARALDPSMTCDEALAQADGAMYESKSVRSRSERTSDASAARPVSPRSGRSDGRP